MIFQTVLVGFLAVGTLLVRTVSRCCERESTHICFPQVARIFVLLW